MPQLSATGRHRRGQPATAHHFAGRGRPEPDRPSDVEKRRRTWGWRTRLLVGAGGSVLVAGALTLLAVAFGRPHVVVSPSDRGLVDVHVSGWGAGLSRVAVTSGSGALAWSRQGQEIVPSRRLAQDAEVRVTATAAAPSWLRWLLGGPVSGARTVRTPTVALATPVAVGSKAGTVAVSFSRPVSVVDYRSAGGPTRTDRLRPPSAVADLAVPAQAPAGTLEVAAAPRPWERVASTPSPVTWFSVGSGSEPVALARPAPGATAATSNGPITLTFARPVADVLGATRPVVIPTVAGSWTEPGPNTLVFTPQGFGFGPGTAVTVRFDRPVRAVGADERSATTTTASSAYHFTVAPGSVLRLEQILAQLHYLPLTFVPAPGVALPATFAEEVASMTRPLPGTFSWTWASTPASLEAEWSVGSPNLLVKGALMAFYAAEGNYDGYTVDPMTVAQLANPSTWQALLRAAAVDRVDPQPYSYVYVTKSEPETLTLWENGSVVLTAAANTGIPVAPTQDGTFPIYERYSFNYMSGYNPDGSYYHDPVYWINYFNGGDAVHGFPRASYGSPQSLGCVELPISTAQVAFQHLAIGDLVTVAG